MNVVIDPYFMAIDDEEEIRRNLPSFQKLVVLCNSSRVNVFLYKGLLEKMLEREVSPFPIAIWKVKDKNLRMAIVELNNAFTNAVMKSVVPLDIENCDGNQEFHISAEQEEVRKDLESDGNYYELLTVLLQPCYKNDLKISECILTGNVSRGRKIGDEFTINCNCQKEYKKYFRFGGIEEFESQQDRALNELRVLERKKEFSYIESPIVVRGKHHNMLQHNSDFTTFSGVSRINKSVLTILRKFGLYKIIFGEYHEDTSYPKGTVIVDEVVSTSNGDIIKGWLFAETGYRNHVDLYFPQKVGESIKLYLNDVLDKNSVERLVDTVL